MSDDLLNPRRPVPIVMGRRGLRVSVDVYDRDPQVRSRLAVVKVVNGFGAIRWMAWHGDKVWGTYTWMHSSRCWNHLTIRHTPRLYRSARAAARRVVRREFSAAKASWR